MTCRAPSHGHYVYFCFYCKGLRNQGAGDHECKDCPYHVTHASITAYLASQQVDTAAGAGGGAGTAAAAAAKREGAAAMDTRRAKRLRLTQHGNSLDDAIVID